MIKVENLSKTFLLQDGTENEALKNINIDVEEGEILGIIGMSGSGKTTLIRTLRGVESFDSGSITVNGYTLNFDDDKMAYSKLKRDTAIHLQRSFGLWAETVMENLLRKFWGVKYGDETVTPMEEAKKEFGDEAMDLLKLMNLNHKANHYALVLSGGEKQRLIMARQLAKKPKVLLLDEPATMSCPKTKQDILDAIKTINEKLGITIVLVSHLPEVHNYLSDRLIFLENGEIKKEGEVREVLDLFLKDMPPIEDIGPVEPTHDTVIKVNDIAKRFVLLHGGDVLSLEDINFDIDSQDIISLIGPSGAGKTVLLRLIAGLELPEAGNICFKLGDSWIDIHEPSSERIEVRKNLGIMHQEFDLMHNATIRDQIAVRLGVKNDLMVRNAREKAKEMELSDELLDALYQLTDLPEEEAKNRLEEIELNPNILHVLFPAFPEKEVKEYAKPVFKALDLPIELLNHKSYELSGGQKVRAHLAIVLASQPDILLLDEPFGDLDPITLRTITNSLRRINKEFKTTILMVSHHIDFIKEVSTRALLIENGALINDGDVNKLCDQFIESSHATYLQQ